MIFVLMTRRESKCILWFWGKFEYRTLKKKFVCIFSSLQFSLLASVSHCYGSVYLDEIPEGMSILFRVCLGVSFLCVDPPL